MQWANCYYEIEIWLAMEILHAKYNNLYGSCDFEDRHSKNEKYPYTILFVEPIASSYDSASIGSPKSFDKEPAELHV